MEPMDLMNDDRPFQIDAAELAWLHSLDMAVATRTSLPVLISAPVEVALPMAIEIAVGDGEDGADGVVVVDAADDRYLQSTLLRAASDDGGQLRAVVVHDVDALSRAQQSTLMSLMADIGRPGACRVISTTSVRLFDRVLQGSFDSDLFYRLNKIHIKVDSRLPRSG
jgi:hypothetical protein